MQSKLLLFAGKLEELLVEQSGSTPRYINRKKKKEKEIR
jgi:hypothetical protein